MHAVLISSESASSVCAHFAVGMRSEVSTTRWSVRVDSVTAESSVVAADGSSRYRLTLRVARSIEAPDAFLAQLRSYLRRSPSRRRLRACL